MSKVSSACWSEGLALTGPFEKFSVVCKDVTSDKTPFVNQRNFFFPKLEIDQASPWKKLCVASVRDRVLCVELCEIRASGSEKGDELIAELITLTQLVWNTF